MGNGWLSGTCQTSMALPTRYKRISIALVIHSLDRLISGKSNPSHFVVDTQGNAQPMGIVAAVLAAVFFVKNSVKAKPLCVVADAFFSKANFITPLVGQGITLVTRLRHDAVGFLPPFYCGRGRPPKRGKCIKLAKCFRACLKSHLIRFRIK